MSSESPSRDHGWWPYLLPYVAFLVTVEIARRTPESLAPWMLVLKAAVPGLLLVWYARRGAYPELRGYRFDGQSALDVAVGLASAVLWMAPFVLSPAIRDSLGVDVNEGFDPELMGARWVALTLALRMLGYALVTPFFEELFIRSFVMRYAEIYPGRGDFRALPIARYSARSFVTTVVVFTLGHLSWEWPVALAWVAATNLWFYRRGHIGSVIVVHATANASILLAAVFGGSWFGDGSGGRLPLWFFV